MARVFQKVAIIGVGLIGGSFALALKQAGAVHQITGLGRTAEVVARAVELGIVDHAASSYAEAVENAELILIATPVAQTGAILKAIAPHLEPETVITDAGSTKADVVAAAQDALGAKIAQFVPGHPIAGLETNGPDAALADLYVGKKVVLTPLPENSRTLVDTVATAWELCGALVHQLSPLQHDRIFAAVSHMPHLLAYALVDQIGRATDATLLLQFAASGFRDFTRIAGSSPEMWRDIALANRVALLAEIDAYGTQLAALKAMLSKSDGAGLHTMFANAQRVRQAWLDTTQTTKQFVDPGFDR